MKKNIVIAILVSIGLIWILTYNSGEKNESQSGSSAVREENGTQYVHILARSGYTPNQIDVKANMPTVLEVETKGTYDCSSSINIPQLGYQKALPPTGVTNIEIPEDKATGSLNILCVMGMYRATVNFSS